MLCKACDTLHLELPDVLVPHKHYGSEVIENVVDGVSTSDDLTTEDYPCEKTMERWKDWIAVNTPQIDGHLRSAGTRLLGLHDSLLASGILCSLFCEKKEPDGWQSLKGSWTGSAVNF